MNATNRMRILRWATVASLGLFPFVSQAGNFGAAGAGRNPIQPSTETPTTVQKSGSSCGFGIALGTGACGDGQKTPPHTVQGGRGLSSPTGSFSGKSGGGNAPIPLEKNIPTQLTKKMPPLMNFGPEMCQSLGCIKSVGVLPSTHKAKFAIQTSVPAQIGIFASLQPLQPASAYSAKHFQLAPGRQTVAHIELTGLAPNSTYHYVAKSTVEGGATLWEKGEFKTAMRSVLVRPLKAVIYDDGDNIDLGDFWIDVTYQGKELFNSRGYWGTGETVESDGWVVHGSGMIKNPSDTFPVTVRVAEDDTSWLNPAHSGSGFLAYTGISRVIEVPYAESTGWKTQQLYRFENDEYDIGIWLEFTLQ
ncbi:MAG: hypothetical protein GY723_14085 [bacterium]|nr:hypothetical protein [bacterium]